MQSTTLRGVFPEPKPIHKRNFVKENVVRIKQIQGVLPSSEIVDKRPRKLSIKRSVKSMSHSSKHNILRIKSSPKSSRSPKRSSKFDLTVPDDRIIYKDKLTHRAVQTERPEDICDGTIMYPSARLFRAARRDAPKKDHGRGDNADGIVVSNPHNEGPNLSQDMQSLDIEDKHDFIKENILALKSRTKANSPNENPKTHPKGTIPKYLKERKEEQKRPNVIDPECPPGHVMLPDEERKETLRVLRQSYADRIKELNNMPVSNDTLKRRQRKIAIEEELKKIEEGIKVFQRPKVFVKINA